MISVLDQLASSLGRQDEAPNLALAEVIAAQNDPSLIADLIAGLDHPDRAICSDALKVLYEAGKRRPEVLHGYAPRFAEFLRSHNNRLVWGGMEVLAALAADRPGEVAPFFDDIVDATESGSVISRDWGVRAIAAIGIDVPARRDRAISFLIDLLRSCKPSEFPRHAESCLTLLKTDAEAVTAFRHICEQRLPDLTLPQSKRTMRVLRALSLDER